MSIKRGMKQAEKETERSVHVQKIFNFFKLKRGTEKNYKTKMEQFSISIIH